MHIDVGKTIEAEIKIPPRPNEIAPRRAYVTKALIEKLGGAEGCLGRTQSVTGGAGVLHSDERSRTVETEMKTDPEGAARINFANKKRAELAMKHGLKRTADEEMEPGGGGDCNPTGRREPHKGSDERGERPSIYSIGIVMRFDADANVTDRRRQAKCG